MLQKRSYQYIVNYSFPFVFSPQSLIESLNVLLTGDAPTSLKQLSLKFMLVLVTVRCQE